MFRLRGQLSCFPSVCLEWMSGTERQHSYRPVRTRFLWHSFDCLTIDPQALHLACSTLTEDKVVLLNRFRNPWDWVKTSVAAKHHSKRVHMGSTAEKDSRRAWATRSHSRANFDKNEYNHDSVSILGFHSSISPSVNLINRSRYFDRNI